MRRGRSERFFVWELKEGARDYPISMDSRAGLTAWLLSSFAKTQIKFNQWWKC
ncbi:MULTISPECIES: hypothetical protein [unclassified Bartonella]|uniref:hypothetical protein n=1 Tax=unclassified Bartonella TaxID=2645622 RepID=UPI0035CF45C7